VINLAHGSLYMVGAYVAAATFAATGSFLIGLGAALAAAVAVGVLLEIVVFRALYERDHLDQVLATFGLILFFNEAVRIIWGSTALYTRVPEFLSGRIEILPGALGVNVTVLYTLVFALGAALAALAGIMAGPIFTVESGMGESVLISAFVVIVIGGIGSIRGAFVAALLVGIADAMGRAYLRPLLALVTTRAAADSAGPALASMLIYILMAAVLFVRPQGLFPPRGR
jgi:branched-chain amino acid transport system permease protein